MSNTIRSPVSEKDTEKALYLLSNYRNIFNSFIKMQERESGYSAVRAYIEKMNNMLQKVKSNKNDYFHYGNLNTEDSIALFYRVLELSYFECNTLSSAEIIKILSEEFNIKLIPSGLSKLKRKAAELFADCVYERRSVKCG